MLLKPFKMFAPLCFLLFSSCQPTKFGNSQNKPLDIYTAYGHVICLDKNKTVSEFTANSFYAYFKPYNAVELNQWYDQNLTYLETELSDMLLIGITEFMKIGTNEQTRIRTRLDEKDFTLRVRDADAEKSAKMANFFAFAGRLLSMVENNTAITDLNKPDFAYALGYVNYPTLDPTQAIDLVGKKHVS